MATVKVGGISALTHRGGRQENQDAYAIPEQLGIGPSLVRRWGCLMVVADGVAGAAGGAAASRLAADTCLRTYYLDETGPRDPLARLKHAVGAANEALLAEQMRLGDPGALKTTLVATLVTSSRDVVQWGGLGRRTAGRFIRPQERATRLWVASIGDSPAYHVSRGEERALRLNTEHRYVVAQMQSGAMTPDEAASSDRSSELTRCLGIPDAVPSVFSSKAPLQAGDFVLACSDGLTSRVSPPECAELLRANPLESAAARMIDLALERRGARGDNVTVVIGEMVEDAPLADTAPPLGTGQPRRLWPVLRRYLISLVLVLVVAVWYMMTRLH